MSSNCLQVCMCLFDKVYGRCSLKDSDSGSNLSYCQLYISGKYIWDKVFKNEPSETCGRQSLKKLKWYGLCLSRPYTFKFFKGCLSQILLRPLLNTLSHLSLHHINKYNLCTNVSARYCYLKQTGNHPLLFFYFLFHLVAFLIILSIFHKYRR